MRNFVLVCIIGIILTAVVLLMLRSDRENFKIGILYHKKDLPEFCYKGFTYVSQDRGAFTVYDPETALPKRCLVNE